MLAAKVFTYVLAAITIALAILISLFVNATDLELAGFWLLAAFCSGFAVLIKAEDSRPQCVRSY